MCQNSYFLNNNLIELYQREIIVDGDFIFVLGKNQSFGPDSKAAKAFQGAAPVKATADGH